MIVNWLEWSDGGLSLHENVDGLAKETIRGSVRPVMALGKDKPDWIYTSVDGKVRGAAETRQEAMDALKKALSAVEVEEHANQRAVKWSR